MPAEEVAVIARRQPDRWVYSLAAGATAIGLLAQAVAGSVAAPAAYAAGGVLAAAIAWRIAVRGTTVSRTGIVLRGFIWTRTLDRSAVRRLSIAIRNLDTWSLLLHLDDGRSVACPAVSPRPVSIRGLRAFQADCTAIATGVLGDEQPLLPLEVPREFRMRFAVVAAVLGAATIAMLVIPGLASTRGPFSLVLALLAVQAGRAYFHWSRWRDADI